MTTTVTEREYEGRRYTKLKYSSGKIATVSNNNVCEINVLIKKNSIAILCQKWPDAIVTGSISFYI